MEDCFYYYTLDANASETTKAELNQFIICINKIMGHDSRVVKVPYYSFFRYEFKP